MKIIFAGTPEFAAPSLRALINSNHEVQAIFTQPDRPKGRGKKLSSSPIKEIALEQDIPIYQPVTLKSEEARSILSKYSTDLIIVVAYGLILPRYVLEHPKLCCLNVHASILPALRGAAPIQYSILNGLPTTGITIMKMETGLDTGDILQQQEIDIQHTDTTLSLTNKLADLGSNLLLDTIQNYFSINSVPQDHQKASYAPKIEKSMARICWQKSAKKIDRIIRALNPNPIAYTEYRGIRIKIYQTEVIESDNVQPGIIQNISPQGLDIGTGQGLIRIKLCQFPGKNITNSSNLYNAYRDFFQIGENFDI